MRWFITIPIKWILTAIFVVLFIAWISLGPFWFWTLLIGAVVALIARAANSGSKE